MTSTTVIRDLTAEIAKYNKMVKAGGKGAMKVELLRDSYQTALNVIRAHYNEPEATFN